MADIDNDRLGKLDVYARTFIPQSLREVNRAPANIFPSEPAPWVDFARYVQTFAGSDFLTSDTTLRPEDYSDATPDKHNQSQTPPTPSDGAGQGISLLTKQYYHRYFQGALKHEGAALQQECDDHALFRVPLFQDGNMDPRPSMFTLHVPGLREQSLRIEVGDIVQLRQLRFDLRGDVTHGSLITNNDGKQIVTPRHADYQYNSVVWGIDRLRECLALRVDGLAPRSMLFNVQFTVQAERLRATYMAVRKGQRGLGAISSNSWMRSMLFPEPSDGYYQKTLNKAFIDLDLYDQLLNYEQSKAVNTVLNETYGTVPFIISGPPGTGKTKTIVELALQLLGKHETSHLLICAPSDSAADTLVQRLSKHLKLSDLRRINAPSRSFPEVPDTVLPYCYVDDGMFSLPSFAELMKCKAVVTTCRDVQMLVRARLSNRNLCELQCKLHSVIHPDTSPARARLHWTGLLIDEAAQATEPEVLLPLSFVTPPWTSGPDESQWPLFVMAGDQHQLGPRTASKQPSMQTSLFERLLDRPFYCYHPLARSKQSGGVMRPLTQDMLPILRPAFANLIRNYRSHPAILATPSSLFYNDTLEPEATDTDSLLSWSGWKGQGWPVLFSRNESPDEVEQDGGGWYNIREAMIACQYVQSFLQHALLQPRDVCIMSPFRAQVRVLRKMAREAPFTMPAVNIGPLEAFQGLESKLVIICTTRTRDRFLNQDVAKGLGVIHERKRFNVALTRAMSGLIVIGNSDVLVKDENWRAFLAFCQRNGLCDGLTPPLGELEMGNGGLVSRLERQLLHREGMDENDLHALSNGVRTLGVTDDDEHQLWESGIAFEKFVRESEEVGR
ncbi:hypothetical protein LTR37_011864 [Vermiconidia calcicola]|uniref:Uncharacterized protein n=1 Tax=Vermiconidia calcicola TaxID=1690605 RepID=A0ACC3N1N7_9PEZI|nr:hypothetical protein LTR37_011864 [Vermiconidia calcicola]